ncbi:uncharacterized protein PHACADRAFT_264869 [Phanerochaete carnosa HHB-10118-sp]|uniref:Uncharacterized protein n=1 Tax=Phanerochaete carnosa (strain HHB-10118-sp) TaxID=650164 RepID=K5VTY6_PHACS|nr:uncharacterized protein PHACADRAFT_264869 [Phanerochaete carnosa HHB-10118-sp]EKM50255.1 hypothetical protein PHACADRAFT_264869 [Phanerochaete carnosa HHB-10118-sp]
MTPLGSNSSICTLDSAAGHTPADISIAIFIASHEGQPADNAAHLVEQLSNLKGEQLSEVSQAVSCYSNRDRTLPYQRI